VTSEAFATRRAEHWQRLARLCEGTGRLDPNGGRELAALYRSGLNDLALLRTLCARERPGEPPIVVWLNTLVGRAHALVYVNRRASPVDVAGFFTTELPAAIRRAGLRVGLCALLLFGSGAVSYFVARGDVALARVLAGPEMTRNAEGFGDLGKGRSEAVDSVMAAFYVTHNVEVAFVAFALGITLGLGTLWVMVQNGISTGVTVALVGHYGSTSSFLAFVSAHAPIELFAIFLAAAAGLGMGHALLAPGGYSRLVALKLAALEAAKLVMGAACLLVVAAFLEAFVSPSSLAPAVKHGIGAAAVVVLLLYCRLGARARPG
jgi:uncharacterized membrane protein SpoIIM required for sporulation